MRNLNLIVSLALSCFFVPGADATPFVFDPASPTAFPRFGTLIGFDEQATLAPVVAGTYASLGVLSIESVEPLPFGEFLYYPSPFGGNYIGTGFFGERAFGSDPTDTDPFGFDGTIRFHFASPRPMVGIGIIETPGAALPVLSILDSSMNLLETFTAPLGTNAVVYAGFSRNDGIAYLEVRGDGFALDNLQVVPEPGTIYLVGCALLMQLGRLRRTSWA